jgi:hypothetical protein
MFELRALPGATPCRCGSSGERQQDSRVERHGAPRERPGQPPLAGVERGPCLDHEAVRAERYGQDGRSRVDLDHGHNPRALPRSELDRGGGPQLDRRDESLGPVQIDECEFHGSLRLGLGIQPLPAGPWSATSARSAPSPSSWGAETLRRAVSVRSRSFSLRTKLPSFRKQPGTWSSRMPSRRRTARPSRAPSPCGYAATRDVGPAISWS